jgi:hypothetical protein
MHPSLIARSGRSAWKGKFVNRTGKLKPTVFLGPFFVAFPNLKEALVNNLPIQTQARSCTILPNFVG